MRRVAVIVMLKIDWQHLSPYLNIMCQNLKKLKIPLFRGCSLKRQKKIRSHWIYIFLANKIFSKFHYQLRWRAQQVKLHCCERSL